MLEALLAVLALWLAIEIALRVALARPLPTGFYGSIPRERLRELQSRFGVRVCAGPGWAQLAWYADPDAERYRVERRDGARWRCIARPRFGSQLLRRGGLHRVWAESRLGGAARLLGEVEAEPLPGAAPLRVPRIDGAWRTLFRPTQHGDYVNDHTIYRDAAGRWRLLGITGPGRGDHRAEKRFAAAVCDELPPQDTMRETAPVADFGELAWAPHVLQAGGLWHLFWSPHRLLRMTSRDGVAWQDARCVMQAPQHPFFRDASVVEVAPGHWLLYATARGRFFSRVDLYQSFDLEGWQYVGPALRCGLGSARNSPFASTESPCVVEREGRWYLSLTYDNGTFFWSALRLALRIPSVTRAFDDTHVFHADQPFDFGVQRGRRSSPTLLTRLRAHAAELVHDAEHDAWWVTTAGWPWAARLTRGEVAIAPLRWEEPDREAGTRGERGGNPVGKPNPGGALRSHRRSPHTPRPGPGRAQGSAKAMVASPGSDQPCPPAATTTNWRPSERSR